MFRFRLDSPLFFSLAKPLVLYVAALYLLGYAVTGFNLYIYTVGGASGFMGLSDAVVPFERVICGFVSLCLFAWFGFSLINLRKTLYGRKK